jgi:hypothetical protein
LASACRRVPAIMPCRSPDALHRLQLHPDSLWETEADMTAGESSGHHQQRLAKFKDIFAAPPVREAYEASVQP